ncbi:MAG: hypothetical protein ACREX6_03455 [Casimicrobiaceae bacterium]
MITPIDFSRLQFALESPRGWSELAVTLVCLGIAWSAERRVALRLAFPLIGLALVYFAALIWRRHVGAPFFLAIAGPLLFTFAGIRMLVYAVRRLFPGERWLNTSEPTRCV